MNSTSMMNNETPEVKNFIGKQVKYDPDSQMIFGFQDYKGGGMQIIVDVRGWGAIQNMFTRPDGTVDFDAAYKFQDELGKFIAEAINQKLEIEHRNPKYNSNQSEPH